MKKYNHLIKYTAIYVYLIAQKASALPSRIYHITNASD